jgi:GNAT superfamily N-acetyltransferase
LFAAGVVVTQGAGGTPEVTVKAEVTGVDLVGAATRQATLEAGRGRELRFDFRGRQGDSAGFRFNVTGAGDADAVLSRLYLDDLFVDPDHRGSGAVGALFDALNRLATERDWAIIRWTTADDNYRARTVYDRLATRTTWITYDMTSVPPGGESSR